MTTEVGILDGTECYCTAQFLDVNGVAYTPTSLEYRLDDLTNGINNLAWTSLSPAPSVTLTITSTQNTMSALSKLKERRQVLLKVGIPGGSFRYDRITYVLLSVTGGP